MLLVYASWPPNSYALIDARCLSFVRFHLLLMAGCWIPLELKPNSHAKDAAFRSGKVVHGCQITLIEPISEARRTKNHSVMLIAERLSFLYQGIDTWSIYSQTQNAQAKSVNVLNGIVVNDLSYHLPVFAYFYGKTLTRDEGKKVLISKSTRENLQKFKRFKHELVYIS